MTIATLIPYITTQPRQKSKRLFSSQRDWTEQTQYEFVVLFVNHQNQEQRTTIIGAGQLVLEEEDGWRCYSLLPRDLPQIKRAFLRYVSEIDDEGWSAINAAQMFVDRFSERTQLVKIPVGTTSDDRRYEYPLGEYIVSTR